MTSHAALVARLRQSCKNLSFTTGPCEGPTKCVICQAADALATRAGARTPDVYAAIRALPSPWRLERSWTDADGGDIDDDPTWRRFIYACAWCGCSYHSETSHPELPDDVPQHPETDCLWPKAARALPDVGDGPAPGKEAPRCP